MENTGSGLLSGMATLGVPQDVYGLWYNKKNLIIDGYRFVNCRFDSCTLHVNSLNFELINCHIDLNTQIIYGGQTIKIIRLYNSRNEYAYENLATFAPEKNSDGTITVRGY